jgi:alpha-1,2-mannosyltransferase
MTSRHSCASAYWTACDAAARGESLYSERLSSIPRRDPRAPRVPRPMGPVDVDPYEYPPSFLPLPVLLRQITPDFWGFRRLWFALTLAVVAVVAGAVARRVDRALGTHACWLTPYILVAPPMIATSHMGNVQLATIALALGAMLLFERGPQAAWHSAFNAAWTTVQTIAAFVLVIMTCRTLREPAGVPIRAAASTEALPA